MSKVDIIAERDRLAPPVATVGLPLVGLTLGTDECWSARFWIKKNRYQQHWCEKVRIVGASHMDLSYSPEHADISLHRKKLRRTIDTWGMAAQQKMAGLKIGVVGLGSVGSIVAETLARMGMSSLVLIDADRIEKHNLDRLLHADNRDIGKYKVALARQHLRHSGTACKLKLQEHTAWIQQKSCYLSALDCDLLFACVDRPLPKDLLNHIALLHCIPIVFGGVYIHSKANRSLGQATWSTSIVAPGSRCLRCDGQYTSSDVIQERDGSLDAPDYLQNADSNPAGNRNVFPFCANLASMMVMQMIRYLIAEDWWSNSTNMYYSYIPNHYTANQTRSCESNCSIREKVAMGDQYNYPFIAPDPKPRMAREDLPAVLCTVDLQPCPLSPICTCRISAALKKSARSNCHASPCWWEKTVLAKPPS